MPGVGLLPLLPKLTAAGKGLMTWGNLIKGGLVTGLGTGSVIGVSDFRDNLKNKEIEKYKRALQNNTANRLEYKTGNPDNDTGVKTGFLSKVLQLPSEDIDDIAKEELIRSVNSTPGVAERRGALNIQGDDFKKAIVDANYDPNVFLGNTHKQFEEYEAKKKAMNMLYGIPNNEEAILRIAKMDNPRALDILQQATLLQEQNRTNPNIVGSDAYTANILRENRDSRDKFQEDSLGIQRQQLGDTRSIAEMGIIQSLIQNQQARIDNQENRNLQLQLRQFDRDDRREDRLDRLDENRRKEKMAIIQMFMRGLEGTARGFTGY